MSVRLIELMCDRHVILIAATRIWPCDLAGDMSNCRDCGKDAPPGMHRITVLPAIDPRTTLAVHEAGHAVVHLAQGTPVDAAELGDERGHVEIGGDGTQWAEGTMAGAAAAKVRADRHGLTARAHLVDIAWSAREDFKILHDHGLSMVDINDALTLADDLVAIHWPAIERVADALLAAGRLSGAEVAAIAGLEVPA